MALYKNNRKYNAKNSNAYRCFTALLMGGGGHESAVIRQQFPPSFVPAGAF